MALNHLLSLPFIFLLALLVSTLLYGVGAAISQKPKEKKRSGKHEPYACGESMPAEKLQVNIERFFLYVTLFMIFDIVAFLLSLSYNANLIHQIIFIAVIASSLLIIVPEIRGKKR
jgi:NADH:ubiquinone oxidoreductase subunit 3 (subunit A)